MSRVMLATAGVIASQAAAAPSFPRVIFPAASPCFTRTGFYTGSTSALTFCMSLKVLENPFPTSEKEIFGTTNGGAIKWALWYRSGKVIFKHHYEWECATATDLARNVEYHIVFSLTTGASAVSRWLVNGVDEAGTQPSNTSPIPAFDSAILGNGGNFAMGNFALLYGTALDLTDSAVKARFYTGGAPVAIADDGTTAFGAPATYLAKGNAATYNGSGGTTTGITPGTWTVSNTVTDA